MMSEATNLTESPLIKSNESREKPFCNLELDETQVAVLHHVLENFGSFLDALDRVWDKRLELETNVKDLYDTIEAIDYQLCVSVGGTDNIIRFWGLGKVFAECGRRK